MFGHRLAAGIVGGFAAVVLIAASHAAFAAAHKGDPVSGKLMYTECEGCHAFGENKIGPNHCGLVGRKAASRTDYASYSNAMKESGLTWDIKTLSAFIAEPLSFVPDTAMGYVGISDEESRLDLIAYIEQQSKDPKVCPQ